MRKSLFFLPFFLAICMFTALSGWGSNSREHPGTGDATHAQESELTAESHAENLAVEGHDEGEPSHEEAIARVLLSLMIIFIAAKIGGELAERFHQPAVLGELMFGVLIGNMNLFGVHALEYLKHDFTVWVLAEIGVIILLFEVGLESNIKEMMAVGSSAFFAAIIGVVTPAFLGYFVSAYFIPEEPFLTHVFIGAILCATSVGITARVLKDLNKLNTNEARIILGAAVIDDIMGLVVLAVVSGVITAASAGTQLSIMGVSLIVIKAIVFYIVAIIAGQWISPKLFTLASKLQVHGMLLITALVICFFLSWAAALIGLAPIVGAFAAGLILDELHYRDFSRRGEHNLEEMIKPISDMLVPVFFVLMGIKVDLTYFGDKTILLFALVLTIAAIIGKQLCGLGVVQKGVDRLAVGVGMIPRGEVGLIFAGIGTTLVLKGEPVVKPGVFGASVIMVILTTLITPPILKILLTRKKKN